MSQKPRYLKGFRSLGKEFKNTKLSKSGRFFAFRAREMEKNTKNDSVAAESFLLKMHILFSAWPFMYFQMYYHKEYYPRRHLTDIYWHIFEEYQDDNHSIVVDFLSYVQ